MVGDVCDNNSHNDSHNDSNNISGDYLLSQYVDMRGVCGV